MKGSLVGIRILDVGTLTPGKYCGLLLADAGAEVLRIERPTAPWSGEPATISSEDLHLNRGKRSITLNLREATGREIFDRLVETADVLIESNRPGVAERIGIDYERVNQSNSRLVYCSLSGFGQDGPNRLQPAYDLTLMGMSGVLLALTGGRKAQATPGTYIADAVSGLSATLAISLALLARERSGGGSFIDLAMFDSLFSILSVSHGTKRALDAPFAEAEDVLPSSLYALYETRDGRQVTIAAIRPSSCRALFVELGRPELADSVWEGTEADGKAAKFLRETFLTADAEEWIARLSPHDIEIGPVRTPSEAFDDSQLAFRRMIRATSHPQAGSFDEIGSPFNAGKPRSSGLAEAAPVIGRDTTTVLTELGYDQARIASFRDAGII
jgi:crotonobetainyl-CoA:carnitine CoA-transferase CaiB-like acyl-CoA transferase